jgi:signal transduction histidine kinase
MNFLKPLVILLLATAHAYGQNPLPSLLSQLKKTPADTNAVLTLKSIAGYYRNINQDSAFFYAQKGLTLSGKLNYPRGIALMNGTLGQLSMNLGKVADAKKQLSLSLSLFEKLKNRQGIASSHSMLGVLAARQGMYKEGTQHLLKALNIFQAINDTEGIIQTCISLGTVNNQANNLDKALDYFNKGRQLNNKLPLSKTTASLLNNIGIVYAKKNDMKSALKYFLEGLQKSDRPEWANTRILLLTNTGAAYQQSGNIKAAYRYQKEALQLVRHINLPDQEISTLVNMASLLHTTKPDSSTLLLRQALEITETINQPYLRLDVYESMVELYKDQHKYHQAIQTLETRNELKDSLFTLKKTKEIAGLQASFDLVNQTLKVQQLQLTNGRIEASRKTIIIFCAGILLLLIVIIVFYTKTRKLNRTLLRQKEELNNLNIFKDKLFSIIGHDLRSPVANIINMLEVFEENIISAKEIHGLVPKLKEQSKITLEIMDKLLSWGKLHLKSTGIHKSLFNAKDLVQKNFQLYKHTAAEKGVSLTDHTPELLMVFADPTHVDFIIRNLIANAVKYTHTAGKVEVEAILNEPSGFNTILIRDNGIGIAGELQQKIFDTDNMSMEGTANELGNSIGLLLCKEFIQENNGILKVESELGKGTLLHVSFPSP